MNQLIDQAQKVRLVIFDVDGVLTTGKLTYDQNGIQHKEFHVLDGQGMKLLKQTGVDIGIITTCKSESIKRRMKDLGIEHLYQGQVEKLGAYQDLKDKLNLKDEEIAYVGDDLPDLPILLRVGFPVTVPNAADIIQKHAHWITQKKGGRGAAREVCEFIMNAQGTYQSLLNAYLKQ